MNGTALARIVLAGVVLLSVAELVAATFAYRRRITPGDWVALRERLERDPPEGPVWVGTPWLAPLARRELPGARDPASVAAPDRHGTPGFAVLTLAGSAPPRLPPGAELPDPVPRREERFGPLLLVHYEQPGAARTGSTLLPGTAAHVTSNDHRCRRAASHWRCPDGRVTLGYAEVEYEPRHCAIADVADDTEIGFRWPDAELGHRLRGHVGFADFNARLRNDAPIRLELAIEGETVLRRVVTDTQGWAPFELATRPGSADVDVRLYVPVAGTWQRRGYDRSKTRSLCIELRTLTETP